MFSYPSPRHLDEIVKLSLLVELPPGDLVEVWRSQESRSIQKALEQMGQNTGQDGKSAGDDGDSVLHSPTPGQGLIFSDWLTSAEYDKFTTNAKAAPLFVIPSFRLQVKEGEEGEFAVAPSSSSPTPLDTVSGFETMLLNLQMPSLLVTSLEEYRQRGAQSASPFVLYTFYTEFQHNKDIVLMRGEILDVNIQLKQVKAMWEIIKRCYASDQAMYERFPKAFNQKPNPTFDFDAYVEECKKMVQKL